MTSLSGLLLAGYAMAPSDPEAEAEFFAGIAELGVRGLEYALPVEGTPSLEPSWVSLSVDLTDGFGLSGRMRLESADRARSLVALGQAQLATLKPMVDTLELTSDDVEVVLRLAMTTAQLESIVKLVGGFANVP